MIDLEKLDREALETLSSIPDNPQAKDRISIPHQEMPSQEAKERVHNMSEVALGYTENQALCEANRCLNCKTKPCREGCPVSIDIPAFIQEIQKRDYKRALEIIQQSSLLPSVCGRVCPQENQCQKYCTVGKVLKDVDKAVGIGRLERFVADYAKDSVSIPEIKKHVLPMSGERDTMLLSSRLFTSLAGFFPMEFRSSDFQRSWSMSK